MKYELALGMFNGNFSFKIIPDCSLESPFTLENRELYDAVYRMVGQILECIHLKITRKNDNIIVDIADNTLGLSKAEIREFIIHPANAVIQDVDYGYYVPIAHVSVSKLTFLHLLKEQSGSIQAFSCWEVEIHEADTEKISQKNGGIICH